MALPFLPINLLIGASFSAYRCPPGQAWRLRLTTVTSNCRLDLIDVLAMLQAFAPVVPDADGLASLFHCRAAWRCRDGEGERGVQCPRNASKRTQVTGWFRPGRGTTHCSCTLVRFSAMCCQENWSQSRGVLCTLRRWEAKMEIQLRSKSPQPQPRGRS
jgi:hypothetical protein